MVSPPPTRTGTAQALLADLADRLPALLALAADLALIAATALL